VKQASKGPELFIHFVSQEWGELLLLHQTFFDSLALFDLIFCDRSYFIAKPFIFYKPDLVVLADLVCGSSLV